MAAPNASAKPDWLLVAVAYFAYVVIGIQSALLGIAWNGPETSKWEFLRETFHLELDSVGWLLVGSTAAVFLVGSISGRLLAGRGVGPLVSAGLFVSAAGLAGFSMSPSWWLVVVCGWLTSLGLGLLDASMNTWFAAHHGARLMNWLHASFGVGMMLGPAVVTASFTQTGTWRAGYMAVGVLQVVAAAGYFFTRHRWGEARPKDAPSPATPVQARDTLRLPVVWLGIGMFVLYTGMEMVPGQWAFSLFTTSRGVPDQAAAVWVGIGFWGGFTLGRISFGFFGEQVPVERLLRVAMLGGIVGALLVAFDPAPSLGALSIAIYGFFTAPIWAMLMLNTQRTLGPDHAPHAIGFQVSAASLGFGVLPAIAGTLAKHQGLESVPRAAIVLCVMILVLFELNQRIRPHLRT